ncbi:hypothetical protein [Variovorax sp. UC122_21]|uniref:hypothetical protein n=1 Tax=Variovorax sp. UC122_21 TaxID=3374554 RepID=UPI0037579E86
MLEFVDPNDSRAVRNKNNILGFYDLVINQKKAEESVHRFVSTAYVQHNPLIGDGADALGKSSARSPGNASWHASWSTRSSPLATMCGPT